MRYYYILIFFLFVQSYFFEIHAKTDARIILKVENEIITNYEIKYKILSSLILANQKVDQTNIDKLKKDSLNSLIDQKIKKNELKKHNIKIDNQQINAYLLSISKNDINSLKGKFKENNLDFKLFLDEIETQFKWQKLIYKIYANKININENLIDKEIKEFIKKNSEINEYKLSEIEFTLDNNAFDNNKIMNIQKEIQNIGFEKAVSKFSISSSRENNGEIGWVSSQVLSSEIFEVISKMSIGNVSMPIKRENSVLFLKLLDKRKTQIENINYNEFKKNLINNKRNEMFDLYSRSHLSKLKNSSLIEYK